MGGSFGWMNAWSHVPLWAISWEEGGGCLRMSAGVLEKVCLSVLFSLLLSWSLQSGLADDEKMWVIKERVGVGWFPFVLKRIFCTLGRKWYRLDNCVYVCVCVYIYIYIHTQREKELVLIEYGIIGWKGSNKHSSISSWWGTIWNNDVYLGNKFLFSLACWRSLLPQAYLLTNLLKNLMCKNIPLLHLIRKQCKVTSLLLFKVIQIITLLLFIIQRDITSVSLSTSRNNFSSFPHICHSHHLLHTIHWACTICQT